MGEFVNSILEVGDKLPCPEPSCDGMNLIERLGEGDGSSSYSYGCKKCGGYFKGVSTYHRACKKYKRICKHRNLLEEDFEKTKGETK